MIKNKKTDLENFIDKFSSNVKNIKPGRVMFKAKNLDNQVASARKLINDYNFDLRVVSNADMASYSAFEVWEGR